MSSEDDITNTVFDLIVLGTGLKECVISGLASVSKMKVLQLDRNNFYGGESASLNLEDLYAKFRGSEKPPKELGRTRDYAVDLCPKFLMACGDLVKMLLHTKVTRYLEFKSVGGSYVLQSNKIQKVPATPSEALNSGLMGIFQKRRFRTFVMWVNNYKESDPKTHEGMDLNKVTSAKVFEYFKLEPSTIQFTGHCIGLYLDDEYLKQPAKQMVERCKLYQFSLSRYGKSPFIYPVWGLGGLPEGFSRLCAVHGGTFMLNRGIDEKEGIVLDSEGKFAGVRSQGVVFKGKRLLADPSYFIGTDRIKKIGSIVRSICITSAPIKDTNTESAQIIIPASEVKRKSDIYISMMSNDNKVCAPGKYISVISTVVETKEPAKELEAAVRLLPKIDQQFTWVTDAYAPTADGLKDNIFISSSYDATSHFESATVEAVDMYSRVTGHKIDLSISADLSGGADEEEAPAPAAEEHKVEKKDDGAAKSAAAAGAGASAAGSADDLAKAMEALDAAGDKEAAGTA